jgi:single-strand DNA-binding protein
MADGINMVVLSGNIGAEPELKTLQSGQAMLKIRLATNRSYKDASGEWVESVDWHGVTVWGKRATALADMLHKGRHVTVCGRLQTRTVDKDDGTKAYYTEVVANQVTFGREGGGTSTQQRGAPAYNDDDDMPNF